MIKITKVTPLKTGTSVEIESIATNYFVQVQKDYNPLDYLEESIRNNSLTSKARTWIPVLSTNQMNCLIQIRDNFTRIITGAPQTLEGLIGSFDNILFGDMATVRFGRGFRQQYRQSEFGKGIYEIFGYEKYFRTKANKGLWLAKQLNIKTCPYCNAQYTLTIQKNERSIKAKFQFDHFFSKKRYPYLSLSLYNLIPSCAPCNLSKGEVVTSLATHFNPYSRNLARCTCFKVEYSLELAKLSIGEVKNLSLSVRFKSRFRVYDQLVQKHNELYEIESSYERHVDITQDLLYKAIVKNRSFKEDVMKIRGLFDGNERLYQRYLIGNYAMEDEILERPLSKFSQDIAKQLGLI